MHDPEEAPGPPDGPGGLPAANRSGAGDGSPDPLTGPEPADPEARLDRARAAAYRALNRRDRTEAELRRLVVAREADPGIVDAVVAELTGLGYVDDAAYALRFAEDRRRLDAWGRERIARRLAELGVAREHVDAALAARGAEEEIGAAAELLARRHPVPPRTRQERDRALGLLLRRGYDAETALAALKRHGADPAGGEQAA